MIMIIEQETSPPPFVTIRTSTYNHAPFIRQCIDGVIAQKTNFIIEYIIGEDCSTDGTREIVFDYARRFPKLIRVVTSEGNVGMKENAKRCQLLSRGKYVALCEGDDYWTDPYKLQKQVDFLEAHSEVGMVTTDYNRYYQATGVMEKNCFPARNYPQGIDFKSYIFDRSTIGTATVMYRSELLHNYYRELGPGLINSWNVGDTALWLYIMAKSRVHYLPEVTAVYRILSKSACHFEDIHETYKFRIKGFDIPFYFAEHFSQDPGLLEKVRADYHRMHLRYRFEAGSAEIGDSSYSYLKTNRSATVEDRIFYHLSTGWKKWLAKSTLLPIYHVVRRSCKFLRKVLNKLVLKYAG